jgi:hypothetical protein
MHIVFLSSPSEFLSYLGRKGGSQMVSPIQFKIDYRSQSSINDTSLLLNCSNAGPFTCAPLDCQQHEEPASN